MRFTFKEYLNENETLNEATLNRIYQHIQKKNVDSWAILTSWKGDLSDKENKKIFKNFRNEVRNKGYGYVEMEGVGQEKDDEGNIKESKEPFLFIPAISKKDAQELSDKYDQYGYVYSGPEVDDKIALISMDGIDYLGKFKPNKIADFFSKVKGKTFVFEAVNVNNWIEGLYWQNLTSNNSISK